MLIAMNDTKTFRTSEHRVNARRVQSLVWDGDSLVDWVGGGRKFSLAGEEQRAKVFYAYSFDAAISSPSGEYAVIFTKLGTKGLVLKQGRVVREINRSYYCADNYEYPVALFRLADGTEVLAHCPHEYNQLELEDVETGRPLTPASQRKPSDFFHSRLTASANGRYLLSAGWQWHPVDAVRMYDVAAALQSAEHLDGGGIANSALWADSSSATFTGDTALIWLAPLAR